MAELCTGCDFSSWLVIAKFHSGFGTNTRDAIEFFRDHGVLPRVVVCERCGTPCRRRPDKPQWCCRNSVKKTKKKRTRCNFNISDYKGTFLSTTHLKPWKVLLFINHWLSKSWDHDTIYTNLKISSETSVKWRQYCSEVTEYWLGNQEAIGGEGVVVEVDESLFVKRKLERNLSEIWMFGGIEEESKKLFVVPFVAPSDKRDRQSLVPLIQQYVLPGSVVVTGSWGSGITIEELGYTHHVVQSAAPDSKGDPFSTHNIKSLWRDIRVWVNRPGMKIKYFWQYFARFLFLRKYKEQRLHRFLIEAGRLYPPHSDRPISVAARSFLPPVPDDLDWSMEGDD